jgi:hypothetical protein
MPSPNANSYPGSGCPSGSNPNYVTPPPPPFVTQTSIDKSDEQMKNDLVNRKKGHLVGKRYILLVNLIF